MTAARDQRAHQPVAGEVLQLRGAHACGVDRFVVTHVGLDVRLSCSGCGARVMLTRQRLGARLVAVIGMLDAQQRPSEDA